MTFSSNFLHAVTFLHVLHLDVLKRHIEIETESKNSNILMYGYNAGQPMAIPICDIQCDMAMGGSALLSYIHSAHSHVSVGVSSELHLFRGFLHGCCW